MTSIKDVAKVAGVSTATVSRVLANKPPIRPETRERVMAAIAELNYRPNLVARSLRVQKSARIGLVVSDIRNPFFTAIGRAVEDAAYEKGYSVLMCNTDENPEKEMLYLNLLHDENVAGIIFSPTNQFCSQVQNFHFDIPTVIIDRSMQTREADMVLLDNVAAAYELTEHLIANGYRRIAGLFGDASATGQERHQGFCNALKAHGLNPFSVEFIAPRIRSGFSAASTLLQGAEIPDAIFTSNSMLMAGAFQAIREFKMKVPEEIALVGFDVTEWGEFVDPPITVIAQPTEEIGRTATELLFQHLANPNRAARTVILKGSLLKRGSSSTRSS